MTATIAPDAATLVQVAGLRKSCGTHEVLKGIDLSVRRGEIVAMIGPSGSGKSTLLRCINQLETHTAGTVTVAGVTIGPDSASHERELQELRRNVGMVFQSFNLFPHLNVLRNVSLAQQRVLGRSQAGPTSGRCSF